MDVSESKLKKIIESYPQDRHYVLAALQDMQASFNYVPKIGLEKLSEHMKVPVSQLYSMATFYKALSLKPKGKHIIKVCNGTACHIRGAMNLVTGLKRELNIEPGETTKDGQFSVELVNCLGACALAPVMLVDETYHNRLKLEDVKDVIKTYSKGA